MSLEIPVPKTRDGRVYRFSPNKAAPPRHFVLGDVVENVEPTSEMRARMKLVPRSTQTVCPYSGVVADDADFMHPDDIKAAHKIVEHAAIADVEASLKDMLSEFNRKQPRNSLIKVNMSMQSESRVKPRFHRRDLLRQLICNHCGRDYGVFAIGLFCPDCGAPNLSLHFEREVDLVETQVDLAEVQGSESQELAYRLLGNAHEDVLTGFEATLKAVYYYGKAADDPTVAPPKVKNDFQNVERARKRFAELDLKPFDVLEAGGLSILKLNIQKRHIIGHNLSVIDAMFAEQSDDARVGETVHLVAQDIRMFTSLCQKVIDVLDVWLGGGGMSAFDRDGIGSEKAPTPVASGPVSDANTLAANGLELSPLAFRLGCFLATQSENGLAEPIVGESTLESFTDVETDELCEAIAELELDSYISITLLTGLQLPRMRYRLEMFATFDPYTVGSNPVLDAAELAQIVLTKDETVRVADLHTKSGWSQRRFNPALGIMIEQIDERRVSQPDNVDYPARHFFLLPADRVELKRYIARVKGQ